MDNTTVLSWNVRGLNAQARRDNVRTLVDDIRPSIVCLQETKLDVISEFLVFSLLGRDFVDFAYLPASSTRGGILIAGRRGSVSLSNAWWDVTRSPWQSRQQRTLLMVTANGGCQRSTGHKMIGPKASSSRN